MVSSYRFYQRNGILQVAINSGERNKKFRISLKAPVSGLEISNNRVQGKTARSNNINSLITHIEGLILKAENINEAKQFISLHLTPNKEPASLTIISVMNEYLRLIECGSIKTKRGGDFSNSSIANIKCMVAHYNNYGVDLVLKNVDLYSLPPKERVNAINKCNKVFNGFIDYLVSINTSPGYQKLLRSIFRTLLTYIKDNFGYDIPGKIRPIYSVVDPLEIPVVAYEVLLNHNVKPVTKIESVYDLMMKIQLQTALRVVDVIQLKYSDINGDSVSRVNQKTKKRTWAPISSHTAEIINKNMEETGDIYRNIFESFSPGRVKANLNLYIKKIAGIKFDKKLSITKQQSNGDVYLCDVNLSEVITSHDLRRLAMNYYYDKGASKEAIKALSGHTKNSAAFEVNYIQRFESRGMSEISKIQSEINPDVD